MNGKNGDILKSKRRLSAALGAAQSFSGPGDLEAAAREYNTVVVFTDTQIVDANTGVTRIIEDSWNGESWTTIYSDDVSTVAVSRREVLTFAGFLRVRHVVAATSGTNVVGATFASGLTYKQS